MANIKTEKICFVIMPFSEQRWEVFEFGIAPACKSAGFAAVRVDQLKGHFNINRKIIEQLFSCDVVIAEITDKNPNVFYEMGVAHALDNKTIVIAQNAQELPFDIRNYRCIVYQQSVKGLQQLQAQIVESLQTFGDWSRNPSNPVQDFKPFDAFISKSEREKLLRELQKKDALLASTVPKAQWEQLQREHQKLQQELAAQEQRLRQAAASSELKSVQQQLAQKTAEVAKLQQELARLQPVPTPRSLPKSLLRSLPIDKLSEGQVKKMLREKNLFDAYENKTGKGITHKYELREREGQKLVLDQTTGLLWQQSGSDDAMVYKDAEKYVRDLNQKRFAGYDDWHLPTLEEGMSLMEPKKHGELYLDRVFDHEQRWIWTSDHYDESAAWVVDFDLGDCDLRRVDYYGCVRVVRGG